MWRRELEPYLLPEVSRRLRELKKPEAAQVTEVRFRICKPIEIVMAGEGREWPPVMGEREMEELISLLCGRSRYAYEAQMALGYIPLLGGHRAGVCGHAVMENGSFVRMSAISSVCLRIARAVPDAGRTFFAHLLTADGRARRVLLLGPPGCGKTTALRNAALYLSDEKGLHVAVVDEREELFASGNKKGEGRRIDVLCGAPKAEGMLLLLRAMSPQVIVTDEVGRSEDAAALMETARSGVGLLASAHAEGMRGMLARPMLRRLFETRLFERYIELGKRASCLGVYDEEGKLLSAKEDACGALGCGADGDDCRQFAGVCDCRR